MEKELRGLIDRLRKSSFRGGGGLQQHACGSCGLSDEEWAEVKAYNKALAVAADELEKIVEKTPKAVCADCGLAYTDPGFQDLLVPDDIWIQISPNKQVPGAGLLCPTCICRRLVKAGIAHTKGRFTSGPLAED